MTDGAWHDWVGRSETLDDVVTATPARALAATLNSDSQLETGSPIPAIWNWLYFLPLARLDTIGPDGHPRRGGFLPPVELPRRMWAGSRCNFHSPLRIGDRIERTSTILKVSAKSGNAGDMVFVTVGHDVHANGQLAAREEQDIVYVGIPERFSPPPPIPLPACDWQDAVAVDPVLLFRFSALTFNGHRIHYDRTYATEVERYPGLVVHGPLQAILLFDAALKRAPPGATPQKFQFRGVRPLFDFETVTLNGAATETGGLNLYTANGERIVGMQASLEWTTP
jgi:3-methylfumaryl-CoA hydratase